MSIILGLVTYFFPVNDLQNKNLAMCHENSKPCGLKVRRYASCLIELIKYLDVFPGAK